MNIFRKILGKTLYYFAKFVSAVLDGLITIVEFIVSLVLNIGRGLLALITAGGCLFLLLFFLGPFGIILLLNPFTITLILILIIVPILGTKFVSYLKYLKYMITEYLFDRADHLIEGKESRFQSFNEYGATYRRMEEEKRRKEQQRRQEQQQREWEERFRQWSQYQQQQRTGGYGAYGQNTGYGPGSGYANPAIEFKRKYEKSCDMLGVEYNADKYQIKLAYRKKAKEYHPDINKSPNATEMFQKINEAYEFLSDAHIERYKNLG